MRARVALATRSVSHPEAQLLAHCDEVPENGADLPWRKTKCKRPSICRVGRPSSPGEEIRPSVVVHRRFGASGLGRLDAYAMLRSVNEGRRAAWH
jgi:hypothetical protein